MCDSKHQKKKKTVPLTITLIVKAQIHMKYVYIKISDMMSDFWCTVFLVQLQWHLLEKVVSNLKHIANNSHVFKKKILVFSHLSFSETFNVILIQKM